MDEPKKVKGWRTPYTAEEEDSINRWFGDTIAVGRYPTLSECRAFLQNYHIERSANNIQAHHCTITIDTLSCI